jgi:hypothetical protein
VVNLDVRRSGTVVARLMTEVDPRETGELRRLLLDAVRRDGRDESEVGMYELQIRTSDSDGSSFVLPSTRHRQYWEDGK